jgi:hypothetical protein
MKSIKNNYVNLLFRLIILGTSLYGCASRELPLLPEAISSNIENYNNEIVIDIPVIWNDFKIKNASVVLEISSKTETVIMLPTSDISLFFYNKHTKSWEKISNIEQYGAGLQKIIMSPDERAILTVMPELKKTNQNEILLLIIVSGTVLMDNAETDVIHSYVVVRLS